MPNAEYHQVVTDDHADLDAAFADWDRKEGLLAAIFIDFLRRQQRPPSGAATARGGAMLQCKSRLTAVSNAYFRRHGVDQAG